MPETWSHPSSPEEMARALERVAYFADEPIATACFLALKMRRPLFCEGEAGVGKTSLARAVAQALDCPIFRLQCYEGLTASEALYDWDFPRQLLHLRAAASLDDSSRERLEADLYDRRFLLRRPILRAFEAGGGVLLIDEVDRADAEFEAFLLEALSEFSVTIPELGTITAEVPPFVVVTSNRTREVHDALKRRCLYHWIDYPTFDRELAIVRRRFPQMSETLAQQVASATGRLRHADLIKPPGVAETLDWSEALSALNVTELSSGAISLTLGALVKYKEDQARLRKDDFSLLMSPSHKS